jgi:hypothetical protein
MDPILFSATADKRKGLSLISPPAAKRRNPSIQPEASSPLRVQSPIGQGETPFLTEVNPPSPQPEASWW